jgi:hypothetical protein
MASIEIPPFSSQAFDDETKRWVLSSKILRSDSGVEQSAEVEPQLQAGAGPRGLPVIDWNATGEPALAPRLMPFPKRAPGEVGGWLDYDPLPKADVVVMTWTSAEWDALHYVFSNALEPLPQNPSNNSRWRNKWYPYRRDFYKIYQSLWTRRLISAARNRPAGAPALLDSQWGSFALVTVGGKTVLLFKSALHINQDGETMPLVTLVEQIIADWQPAVGGNRRRSPAHRCPGRCRRYQRGQIPLRRRVRYGEIQWDYTCVRHLGAAQPLSAGGKLIVDRRRGI